MSFNFWGAAMFVLPLLIVVAVAAGLYYAYDRHRYRGTPGVGQRPTNEIFRDPVSGQLMRVYEDPATGQRDYRPEK